MRLAETELHLAMEVMSNRLTINGLLRRFEALDRELLAELVDAAQRQHLRAVRRGEARPIRCPRWGGTYWVKRGSRDRQLTTSQGKLRFPLRQVTCKTCDRTWSPFVERLGEELREKRVGLVAEVSYRKAHRFGKEAFGATLSPMGIWRRVQRWGREVELTGGRGADAGALAQAGRKRRGAGHADAVADAYTEARPQRCEWHLVHSLDHALWNDGVDYRRRGRLQGEGRDRRAEIRAWAADRLGPHERSRSLATSTAGEVRYERPSSLRTTSHAERQMRELNRRTHVGA